MAFLFYSVAETSEHHGEYNASHTKNENFFCGYWGVKKYWFDWVIVDQFHFKRQSNVHLPVGWGGGREPRGGVSLSLNSGPHGSVLMSVGLGPPRAWVQTLTPPLTHWEVTEY